MVVALIGLPGGCELRYERLRELVALRLVDFYEVRDQTVVLYWRGLAAGRVVELSLDVAGAVPGRYTAAASRAYVYYGERGAEARAWAPGLRASVQMRGLA